MAETASTNADLKARAAVGEGEGLWLRAERQTSGKGRLGRHWISPPGNVYCSTIVECREGDPSPATLSFVSALAVLHTVAALVPQDRPMLKWPNDLLIDGAKFCGILLETIQDKVIVGIGINVATAPQVEGRRVTSLHEAGASPALSAEHLYERLSQEMMAQLHRWRNDGLHAILADWQRHAHPVGTRLQISDSSGEIIEGDYQGLAADGALRLRKQGGELIEVRAGDVDIG